MKNGHRNIFMTKSSRKKYDGLDDHRSASFLHTLPIMPGCLKFLNQEDTELIRTESSNHNISDFLDFIDTITVTK